MDMSGCESVDDSIADPNFLPSCTSSDSDSDSDMEAVAQLWVQY